MRKTITGILIDLRVRLRLVGNGLDFNVQCCVIHTKARRSLKEIYQMNIKIYIYGYWSRQIYADYIDICLPIDGWALGHCAIILFTPIDLKQKSYFVLAMHISFVGKQINGHRAIEPSVEPSSNKNGFQRFWDIFLGSWCKFWIPIWN